MAVLRFVALQSISILRSSHALKDVFPAAVGRAEIKQEMPNLKNCQNISRWVRQCFKLALDLFGIDLGRQESTGGLFLNLFFLSWGHFTLFNFLLFLLHNWFWLLLFDWLRLFNNLWLGLFNNFRLWLLDNLRLRLSRFLFSFFRGRNWWLLIRVFQGSRGLLLHCRLCLLHLRLLLLLLLVRHLK